MAAMPANTSWKAYAALLVGVLILSLSAILTAMAQAPGTVVSFYRVLIGNLVLLLPFWASFRKDRAQFTRRGVWLALLAGLFFGLDLAAWATSIRAGGATIPTLLGNLAPIWVALGAWLIFKEQLNWKFWSGLGLALVGVLVVLDLKFEGGLQATPGAGWGLVSAVFYGAYLLTTQKGRDHLNALSFFWLSALGSAVCLLALVLLFGDPLTGYPPSSIWAFIGLGVVVQGVGWLLITYTQGYLPASIVSPTLLIQPVLTAFLAGPLLGEQFSPQQWLGGAAVLLGIIVVYRSRLAPRAATAA